MQIQRYLFVAIWFGILLHAFSDWNTPKRDRASRVDSPYCIGRNLSQRRHQTSKLEQTCKPATPEFAGFTPDGEVVTATSEGVVEFRAMEAGTTPNRIDCLPRYASHQRGWMLPRLGN